METPVCDGGPEAAELRPRQSFDAGRLVEHRELLALAECRERLQLLRELLHAKLLVRQRGSRRARALRPDQSLEGAQSLSGSQTQSA